MNRDFRWLVVGTFLFCVGCATPIAQHQVNVDELRAKAESGDANAAVEVGALYDQGVGVQKNLSEATKWYRFAAEKGNPEGQNSLGSLYQAGEGVPKNDLEAVRWYSMAADQGHRVALFNLGYMYDRGLGVPEDNRHAVELYTRAAEKGEVKAMLNLGIMYGRGEKDVDRDPVQSFMWLDLGRFYTQRSNDMTVKWRLRGALDELKSQMTKDQITRGEELSKQWDNAHRPR